MSEWKEYKLEDFAEINPTERLPKGAIAKKIAMEIIQPFTKKIPTYSIEECKGGVKFKNGDTIMARITPSLENGKTSYVEILDENEIGFGSTEFIVFREKENVSDKHFIYYLATSPIVRNTAIKSMTGSSGRQRVQTDVVKEHLFLAPPLPEQKAIASVLSSLDDKIDLLHRQNKTLEAMSETLFRQWFVEEAEEDWEEGVLGDISENIKNGIKHNEIPSKTKYVALEHIEKRNISLNKFSFADNVQSNKFQFEENDILFGKLRPYFHKVCFTSFNGVCSTDILVLRPKINDYFPYCLFAFFQNEVVKYANSGSEGTRMPRTNWDILSSYPISIPPIDRIKKFNKIVEPSLAKIKSNQFQIRTLETLRDTLLPKLMSGEVRVSSEG